MQKCRILLGLLNVPLEEFDILLIDVDLFISFFGSFMRENYNIWGGGVTVCFGFYTISTTTDTIGFPINGASVTLDVTTCVCSLKRAPLSVVTITRSPFGTVIEAA